MTDFSIHVVGIRLVMEEMEVELCYKAVLGVKKHCLLRMRPWFHLLMMSNSLLLRLHPVVIFVFVSTNSPTSKLTTCFHDCFSYAGILLCADVYEISTLVLLDMDVLAWMNLNIIAKNIRKD